MMVYITDNEEHSDTCQCYLCDKDKDRIEEQYREARQTYENDLLSEELRSIADG